MRAIEFLNEADITKAQNPELVKQIKDYWDEGWNAREISELLGITYNSVFKYLWKYYPDRPGKILKLAHALTDTDKQNIVAKWNSGESLIKIQNEIGIDKDVVIKILRSILGDEKFRQDLENRKGRMGYRVGITPEQVQEFAKLYSQGNSTPFIAKEFGISDGTVRMHLKNLPNFNTLYQQHKINRQTKTRKPTTTGIYRSGTSGNLKSKGTSSRHAQGVQWR